MHTEAIITEFIRDELLGGEPDHTLEREASLISTGILDSLALLKLLLFLEERFGVKVRDGEVVPLNFETIARISSFVEARAEGARS